MAEFTPLPVGTWVQLVTCAGLTLPENIGAVGVIADYLPKNNHEGGFRFEHRYMVHFPDCPYPLNLDARVVMRTEEARLIEAIHGGL